MPSAHVRTVSIGDDRRVAYAEYGVADGRPCLFLHGTPGSRLLGRLFDDAAHRADVRLLAIDRPGYGRSAPWPTRTLPTTPAFVGPVLDDAGVDRVDVVGFSGGGAHAFALAANAPDRVGTVDVVSGAVPPSLASGTPPARRLLERLATTAPTVLGALFRGQAWLADALTPAAVVAAYTTAEGRAALPPDVAALVARDFVEAVTRTRRGAITELRVLGRPWGVSLDRIDRPVRLWHGGDDANVPVDGVRTLRDRLPDARLTVFEDADHLTALIGDRAAILDRSDD